MTFGIKSAATSNSLHLYLSTAASNMKRLYLCIHLCSLILYVQAEWSYDARDEEIVRKVFKQCTATGAKYSCLANKVALVMEKAIDWDIPLFDGLKLKRNSAKFDNATTPRSFSGIQRLAVAAYRFLEAHTLSLDLTQEDKEIAEEQYSSEARGGGTGIGGSGGGGGGIAGGSGLGGKKGSKKEKKYMQYALMVLLGIFGLTGPLIMKTLALIAGKALIASKIALIIVGSVALKKIFEKDHDHSTVKVHTHTLHHDDDHDRMYTFNPPFNPSTSNYPKPFY